MATIVVVDVTAYAIGARKGSPPPHTHTLHAILC